ncbi:MAG: hypothetical protein V4463_06865 [Pseudomonadota bacterium]
MTFKHAGKTLILSTLLAFGSNAFAVDGDFQTSHPRRAEVNARLAKQNQRIKKEVKEGEITKDQAKSLHQEDKAIRSEERTMASLHNGHITKAEQKSLNQQENAVSKQIGK